MGRPSPADRLAHQLSTVQTRAGGTGGPSVIVPTGLVAVTAGSPTLSSPGFSSDSYTMSDGSLNASSPLTPDSRSAPTAKFQSRPARALMGGSMDEVDFDDDDNDDEDFGGYGRRRKKETESLMDLLKSEPPEWMLKERQPVQMQKKRSFFSRLGSSTRYDENMPVTPSLSGLSTLRSNLRTAKSSSSLLSNGTTQSRKKQQLQQQPSAGHKDLNKSPIYSDQTSDLLHLTLGPPIALEPLRTSKFKAKEATARHDSSSDLIAFLRNEGPAQHQSLPAPAPLHHRRVENGFSISSRRSSLTRTTLSTSATSVDTSASVEQHVGAATILKAVVSKVGAGARRASVIRTNSAHSLSQILGLSSPPGSPDSTLAHARESGSLWRGSDDQEYIENRELHDALHETVSPTAAELARGSYIAAASRIGGASSLYRMDSSSSKISGSGASSPGQMKRVSRKPPPSIDSIDCSTLRYQTRPLSPFTPCSSPPSPVREDGEQDCVVETSDAAVFNQRLDDSTPSLAPKAACGLAIETRPPLHTPGAESFQTAMEMVDIRLQPEPEATVSRQPDWNKPFSRARCPTAPLPAPADPVPELQHRPASICWDNSAMHSFRFPPAAPRRPAKAAARFSSSTTGTRGGQTVRLAPSSTHGDINEAEGDIVRRPSHVDLRLEAVESALFELRRATDSASMIKIDVSAGDQHESMARDPDAAIDTSVLSLVALQGQMRAAANLIDVLVPLMRLKQDRGCLACTRLGREEGQSH